MSLYWEEEVNIIERVDRLPVVKDKEVMMMDVAEGKETRKEIRAVLIARRKRKGQPRASEFSVKRIDYMFKDLVSSPMVVDYLGGNVGNKRKHLSDKGSSMVADRTVNSETLEKVSVLTTFAQSRLVSMSTTPKFHNYNYFISTLVLLVVSTV